MDLGAFFRDYGTPFATAIALLNTIISLVIGQYFKDSPRARIVLVGTSIVLGGAAVVGTFYSQYQIVSSAKAEAAHHAIVREGIGRYIKLGDSIMNEFAQNKWPVVEESDWTGSVKQFLHTNLNDSYVSRFEDSSGIQPITIKSLGADVQHDNEYVYMHNRITRLEELSHELP